MLTHMLMTDGHHGHAFGAEAQVVPRPLQHVPGPPERPADDVAAAAAIADLKTG